MASLRPARIMEVKDEMNVGPSKTHFLERDIFSVILSSQMLKIGAIVINGNAQLQAVLYQVAMTGKPLFYPHQSINLDPWSVGKASCGKM